MSSFKSTERSCAPYIIIILRQSQDMLYYTSSYDCSMFLYNEIFLCNLQVKQETLKRLF